jgi:glycosyltransferase involved in cell wall biosynthesis
LSVPVRVHVVDPSAFTPPYDHAFCTSLAQAGAEVELYTCRFRGGVAPALGYARREFFYRSSRLVQAAPARPLVKLAEHVPDMLRYRRAARAADIVHFQWITVAHVDGVLLPRQRPLVYTAHDILSREPRPGQRRAERRLYPHFDAVVVHSENGRRRLVDEVGVDPARVHVIPHGAFVHLSAGEEVAPRFATERPVVLFFGLLRPYKGIDVLLEAWRGIEGAELWIVGKPRMDVSALAAAAPARVRLDARFVSDAELRGYFRRADLVVLPYREADQSGVLFTALAFGKPLLVTDVGGLSELTASGAARAVPAGDAPAMHRAFAELLAEPGRLRSMADRAAAVAREEYPWEATGRRTLALYEALLGKNGRR